MACIIFCLVNGSPVQMEISPVTHTKMRVAAFQKKTSVESIAAMAFKKYGRKESSILKFLKRDLKKLP